MAKQRLSKIQKWVLVKALTAQDLVSYSQFKKEFFQPNKTTRSQQAVMAKSLKNLVDKKFLGREPKSLRWVAHYFLTGQGFLKANEYRDGKTTVSFKNYQKVIGNRLADRNMQKEKFAEIMRKKFLAKRRPSERMKKWYAPYFNGKS